MTTHSPAFKASPAEELAEWRLEDTRRLEAYVRPSNLDIRNFTITGSQRNIPARIYVPRPDLKNEKQGALPALIWFHGGAFVFGDIDMGEGEFTACEIASRGNCLVVSVDYKLAGPDERFPVCQIDGFDALIWLFENATLLGVDPDRIFVGGGSAGACLSGSVSLMARERHLNLAGVLPIYPLAHQKLPPFSDEIIRAIDGIDYISHEFAELHNPWLMASVKADSHYCWPGDEPDKSNQPPFLIIHAELDSLRSSGELWADQLREDNVEVEEHVESGALHGYLGMGPTHPQMNHTTDLMVAFIASH